MPKIYRSSRQYWEYTRLTNEKKELQKYIRHQYLSGKFPIKKKDTGKHILDLGCGNGINTVFSARLFPKHAVQGIDESNAQVQFAKKHHSAPNLSYKTVSFAKFKSNDKYDFILISHVLQHLSMNLDVLIEKAVRYLNHGGEIWIVSQTRKGMYQIIKHQQKLLENDFLKNWKTAEDYIPEIKKILRVDPKRSLRVHILKTSFKNINFASPSKSDKLRLEFIFGLKNSFDSQSQKFKYHLATSEVTRGQRISHPNAVIVIK